MRRKLRPYLVGQLRRYGGNDQHKGPFGFSCRFLLGLVRAVDVALRLTWIGRLTRFGLERVRRQGGFERVGRNPRRVRYDELRRYSATENCFPFDDEAERGAIGALLIAPNKEAKRMGRKLFDGHFYLPCHGWLWARATWALSKGIDFHNEDAFKKWAEAERLFPACRQKFGVPMALVVLRCTEGFWWNGDWYIARVLAASKVRARLVNAGENLEAAIEATESGWQKGSWT